MPFYGQIFSQDAISITILWLIRLHDHLIIYITIILSLVIYILYKLLNTNKIYRYVIEAQILEIIWTILPCLTLLSLAFPSLHTLYLIEEIITPEISFKVIAHQWYWTYEYTDFNIISFDSYLKHINELKQGEFRLLETDNRIVTPVTLDTRTLVTSRDVIHSWALPSLGLKIDAIPGRLNQLNYIVTKSGVYYGQCSEICGANHSFIPIVIEAIRPYIFYLWAFININL